MKTIVQEYVENGMQQVAAEVAERTARNVTQNALNGKRTT